MNIEQYIYSKLVLYQKEEIIVIRNTSFLKEEQGDPNSQCPIRNWLEKKQGWISVLLVLYIQLFKLLLVHLYIVLIK